MSRLGKSTNDYVADFVLLAHVHAKSSVSQASRKVKTGSATSSPRWFHLYCVCNPYHLITLSSSSMSSLPRFYFPQKRPQGSAGPCWKRCEDDVRHLIRNPTTTRRHQEFYEINNLKRLSQKENRIYFNDGSTCCRLQWFSCI